MVTYCSAVTLKIPAAYLMNDPCEEHLCRRDGRSRNANEVLLVVFAEGKTLSS